MSLRAYDRLRLALTAIGAGISAYLTLLHYDSHVPLVCSGGPLVNCEQVLTSPSSIVLGVPVAAYGLVWFAVAVALAVRSLRVRGGLEPPRLRAAGLAWTALGTLSVLWLIYQELGVVGKICAWCTAVHLIVIAVLVLQVLSDPLRTGQGPASG
jgi:uncharacterized membrane protein